MMPTSARASKGFDGLPVAAFESRMAEEMGRLIAHHGGRPLLAPSMREIPLEQNHQALAFGERFLRGEFDLLILLTGVGTRALVDTLATRHPRPQILEALARITRVCRGPKPAAALKDLGITPGLTVPEPNTWAEILQTLDRQAPARGKRVAVQEYGISNLELLRGLKERGAEVVRVPIYRWGLPAELGPLREALAAIADGRVTVALFTNAQQVENVLSVARDAGLLEGLRAALARGVVGSVGPVASQSLRDHGLTVDVEPEHPKMGPLVRETSLRCHAILGDKRAAPGKSSTLSARRPARALVVPTTGPAPATAAGPTAAAGLDAAALAASPFLRACRRQPTPVTPIWLMRQAGRYMREYRQVRAKVGFLELCKTPDLVAEMTVYAVERLRVDAAIIFADLLLPVEAMGLGLAYGKGEGPIIDPPLRGRDDVERLREPPVEEALGYVLEAIRLTRRALRPEVPLIGFAGAPFTVASYMIEGGGARHYVQTKSFFRRDPQAWHLLMERITRFTSAYLGAQVAAGAQAVQLFDSWVGCLSPEDYRTFVLPHSRRLLASLPKEAPSIHFGTDTAAFLDDFRAAGGDVVGLDWRVDLVQAWDRLGEVAVMGNLDPTVLFAPRDEVRRQARALLQRVGGRPGHIFNLGHGILPNTPLDNVLALVDAVHEREGA
jgi:uroporphyrinogen decarboxylase